VLIGFSFAGLPTKGLILSKASNGEQNSMASHLPSEHHGEGTSVDPPLNHQEIARLLNEQELPLKLVPDSLPQAMRENATNLQQEDFDALYDVPHNKEILESGAVSPVQLVIMYMHSFRNIMEYDLVGVEEMKDRFIRYFGNILADTLEVCYPLIASSSMGCSAIVSHSVRCAMEGKMS